MSKYVAKKGKIFGPFPDQEIEKLRASGRISEYSWLWNAQSKTWEPLDPAPLHGPKIAPPPHPGATRSPDLNSSDLKCSVILLPAHGTLFVAGSVVLFSESGCEVKLNASGDDPRKVLPPHGKVRINLLSELTGMEQNHIAYLDACERDLNGWKVRLAWKNCPELLAQN